MLFNIGGAEILVIAMVALIAVGPEQLPSVLRRFGHLVAKARNMTSGIRDEFMAGLDEVKDITDPDQWFGSGSDADPIVPRGYAKQREAEKLGTSSVSELESGTSEPASPSDTNGAEAEAITAEASSGASPAATVESDASDSGENEAVSGLSGGRRGIGDSAVGSGSVPSPSPTDPSPRRQPAPSAERTTAPIGEDGPIVEASEDGEVL